jgi:hypothetical protein
MKGSDKETTITAEEYAQILKNAAETAQVAEDIKTQVILT